MCLCCPQWTGISLLIMAPGASGYTIICIFLPPPRLPGELEGGEITALGGPGKAAADFQNKASPPSPRALRAAHSFLCNIPEHSCFLSPLSPSGGLSAFKRALLGIPQQLGLCSSTAGGKGSIPGQRAKNPHATWYKPLPQNGPP